jgi:hypothetical protein
MFAVVACNIRERVNESWQYLQSIWAMDDPSRGNHKSVSNISLLSCGRRRRAVLRYIPNIELSVEVCVGGMLPETPLAETVDVSGSSGPISSEAASQNILSFNM